MISNYYRIIKGLKSNSASSSDIIIVQDIQSKKEYILKVFIQEYIERTKRSQKRVDTMESNLGLWHEIQMYKTIRDQIILPFNVRNLLCIQGDGTFDSLELARLLKLSTQLSDKEITKNITENTKYMLGLKKKRDPIDQPTHVQTRIFVNRREGISSRSYIEWSDPIRYHYILTPRINTQSLEDFCKENLDKLDVHKFMNYIFIALLTEYILSAFGINQNDLHWYNILLDDQYFGPSQKHKRTYLLVYNDTILFIDNPYIPYIYDFDRTAVRNHIIRPNRESNLISGGNCPTYHSKRDFIRTLCMIYSIISDYTTNKSEYKQIQEDILNDLILSPRIRRIIKKSSTCWLEDRDDVSIACKANMLKDVKSNQDVLSWALTKTDYKRFTISQLLDVEQHGKDSIYYSLIHSILEEFKKDIPQDMYDIHTFYANVQFCNTQDIHYWDMHQRKTHFIQLIYNLLKQ